MRRRGFLAAAAILPLAAAASPDRSRRIGVLVPAMPGARALADVRADLDMRALGWPDGSLVLDIRGGPMEQIVAVARELVDARPDVLVTVGTPFTRALHSATRTIPIVAGLDDPIASGVAASLAVPGGNVTGLAHTHGGLLESKGFEWVRKIVPNASRIVFLMAPRYFSGEMLQRVRQGATSMGFAFQAQEIAGPGDLRKVLKEAATHRGTCVQATPLSAVNVSGADIGREAIAARVPTFAANRAFVIDGCLLAYEVSHSDYWGRMRSAVDRILRGADPGRIPFELPDRSFVAVNRATAGALGLELTREVLVGADLVAG
jgi:putative ABC transport system substrate-binding protein